MLFFFLTPIASQIFAAIERLDGGFDGLNQARARRGFLPLALLFIRFIPDTRVLRDAVPPS